MLRIMLNSQTFVPQIMIFSSTNSQTFVPQLLVSQTICTNKVAIKFSDHCAFISTDDKFKIKVGEPNFPVAAVAHGKRVLLSK